MAAEQEIMSSDSHRAVSLQVWGLVPETTGSTGVLVLGAVNITKPILGLLAHSQ